MNKNRAIIDNEITQGAVGIGLPKAYKYDAALVETAKAIVEEGLEIATDGLAQKVINNSVYKLNAPLDVYGAVDNGTAGQILRTKGDGNTEWVVPSTPSDEQVAEVVTQWLDDHPEATTTVEDGSLTRAKFATALDLGTAVICQTKQQMIADTSLKVGYTVLTKGYHSVGDGGGALYNIREKEASDVRTITMGGVDVDVVGDDGSVVAIGNSLDPDSVTLVAELITDGVVNVKQFGAKGDGVTDDTDAIVAAADYCATNDKILYSDEATYKTTSSCIINMVKQVEMHGHFDNLEIRYNYNTSNPNVQTIDDVGTLIIRDYKGSTFHIGKATDVQIIADNAYKNGSSSAYNMFYGGTWESLSLIGGVTGGWINDNAFYRLRINTIAIGKVGSYQHNNNRFHDITMEGARTIDLGNANGNYFLLRGEGGVTVNTTSNSINNVVETTWTSSPYTSINEGVSVIDTNLQGYWLYDKLKLEKIFSATINNLPWNNSHDFANGIAHIAGWSAIGKVLLEMADDVIIKFRGNGQRLSVFQYDSEFNVVAKGTAETVHTSNLSYDSTNNNWYSSSNRDFAYIYLNKSSAVKYILIYVSNGNADKDVADVSIFAYSPSGVSYVTTYNCVTSNAVPTLTTDVPKGFEVLNTGSNATIWKWVFNGTSWVAVNYPT